MCMTMQAAATTLVAEQKIALLPDNVGLTMVLCGYWRGEKLTGMGGRIVLRMVGPKGVIRENPALVRKGTFDWAPFEVKMAVPEETTAIHIYLEAWQATGTVWYDDVSLKQIVRK